MVELLKILLFLGVVIIFVILAVFYSSWQNYYRVKYNRMYNTFGVPGVTGQEEYENAEKELVRKKNTKRPSPAEVDVVLDNDDNKKSETDDTQA